MNLLLTHRPLFCIHCSRTRTPTDPLTGEIGLSGSEFASVLSRACVDFPPEITKATIEVRDGDAVFPAAGDRVHELNRRMLFSL